MDLKGKRLLVTVDEVSNTPYMREFVSSYQLLLREELPIYLIMAGLQGLERVLKHQSFTTSEKVMQNLKEYEESNNPILMFFKEIEENEVLNNQTKYVYQRYAEFCIGNSFQQLSNIEFSKQVKRYYNCDVKVKSIDGKSVRVFTR